MIIEKNIKVKLDKRDEFEVVWDWVVKYPDVVKKMMKIDRARCPFLFDCNKFPCDTLYCEADCLYNGHPYRMS